MSGDWWWNKHTWSADAGAEPLQGNDCDCINEKGGKMKVPGIKVTIGHQYAVDGEAEVTVKGGLKGAVKAGEIAELGAEVGVEIKFAKLSEASNVTTYHLICPTDGENSAPTIKHAVQGVDSRTHPYHRHDEPIWRGFSKQF